MKTKSLLIKLAGILMMLLPISMAANNIQLTGTPKLVPIGTTGTGHVTFNLSWDNSWRTNTPNNWDAAWVFVKFKDGGGDNWAHAYLDTIGHSIANSSVEGMVIKPGTSLAAIKDYDEVEYKDKVVGVFIHRGKNGQGRVELTDVRLKWDYKAQWIEDLATLSLRVFALEMVYVPEGAFYAGDGWVNANVPEVDEVTNYTYPNNGNTKGTTTTPNGFRNISTGISSGVVNGSSNMLSMMTNNDSVAFQALNTTFPATNMDPCYSGRNWYQGPYTNYTVLPSMPYFNTAYSFSSYSQCNAQTSCPNNVTAYIDNSARIAGKGMYSNSGNYSPFYTPQNTSYLMCPYVLNWVNNSSFEWQWFQIRLTRGFRANWFRMYHYVRNYNTRAFYIAGSMADSGEDNFEIIYGSDDINTNINMSAGQRDYSIPAEKQNFYRRYRIYWYQQTYQSNYNNGFYNINMHNTNGVCGNWEGDDDFLENRKKEISNSRNPGMSPVYVDSANHARLRYSSTTYTNRTGAYKLANGFPTGYKAFYVMKYELTQQAYADFLNCLKLPQQQGLTPPWMQPTLAEANRSTYYWGGLNGTTARTRTWIRVRPGAEEDLYGHLTNATGDGTAWKADDHAGNVAMAGLRWRCAAAYLDWAGLRPLTELEFEKMARGGIDRSGNPIQPKPYEYVWGSTTGVNYNNNVPANLNKGNEAPNASVQGANLTSHSGTVATTATYFPVRVGYFAPAEGTTRAGAAAAYYGIYNLGDNVMERYVTLNNADGWNFAGSHGDGNLASNGFADQNDWPNNRTANGTIIKGTDVNAQSTSYISLRNQTTIEVNDDLWTNDYTYYNYQGCRGGRTAE